MARLPDEIINEIVMNQRPKYPWGHKEINREALRMELWRWAESYCNQEGGPLLVVNVATTINSYMNAIEDETIDADDLEEVEDHKEYVQECWDDFADCINRDWEPLEIDNYKPLDSTFMKNLRYYWHHRY